MDRIGIEDNVQFYQERKNQQKDLIFDIIWAEEFPKECFDHIG